MCIAVVAARRKEVRMVDFMAAAVAAGIKISSRTNRQTDECVQCTDKKKRESKMQCSE